MNIANAFPSQWLRASDFEDGDMTYTIKKVLMKDVGQGDQQETKPVLFFQETDLGLVLNKTNANTLTTHFGPETDDWSGEKVMIGQSEVEMGGKLVAAVRIRTKKPKPVEKVQKVKDPNDPFEDEE